MDAEDSRSLVEGPCGQRRGEGGATWATGGGGGGGGGRDEICDPVAGSL